LRYTQPSCSTASSATASRSSWWSDASRFARDLIAQELGVIKRGMRVITASDEDLTEASDPSRVMMRQIAGSFAEYEKARPVAKLKAARERKRAASPTHKCEGRKSWAEINPELVREAKRLRRGSSKGHQRSLREVAAELAKLGFMNERGVTFSAASVRSILIWSANTSPAFVQVPANTPELTDVHVSCHNEIRCSRQLGDSSPTFV
jgi:hypothetical protein